MMSYRTNRTPTSQAPAPVLKDDDPRVEAALSQMSDVMDRMFYGERDVFSVALSERGRVRIIVSGPYGLREVEAVIRMLEAQRDVMGAALDSAPATPNP